ALPGEKGRSPAARACQLSLERPDSIAQVFALRRQRLLARREVVVGHPPVQTDLLRLVDGTDQEANANRQELDFRERKPDIAGHDEALVENPIEDLNESGGTRMAFDG